MIVVAIDIGGTFTDLIGFDDAAGRFVEAKSLTTPAHLVQGIIDCIKKSGLAAGAQTTAAILAVTGATTATMNIVAQAFGLSILGTDLVAGTYLYRLPPSATQMFVSKLQTAYRRGAAAKRSEISTPTSALY